MATGRLPDPNTAPVTAKGDLYTYSTVPAKLAVGNNGETLVADSSATTGLRWQGNFAAGKNKIINGDFGIWQRGTSFSTVNAYTADRFDASFDGTGGTRTVSQQTFTPGTAPVAGYEGWYFYRYNKSVGGTGGTIDYILRQKIEDVRTFAGQTVTLSFWAKANTSLTINSVLSQNFGSGGSSSVEIGYASHNLTTSWQRFTTTHTLGSMSGKTIGTSSFLMPYLYYLNTNGTFTIDIWGVQLEAGNTATAFQTATGTLAGELAACQRYYQTFPTSSQDNYALFGTGYVASSTSAYAYVKFNTTMRNYPTVTFGTASNYAVHTGATTATAATAMAATRATADTVWVTVTVASGLTAGNGFLLIGNNTASAKIEASAEL